jgi:hypothetical protein
MSGVSGELAGASSWAAAWLHSADRASETARETGVLAGDIVFLGRMKLSQV